MNKNILIILIIGILIVYYLCYNSEHFISIPNKETKQTYNELYEVGTDDENKEIYKYKSKLYKLSEDDLFVPFQPKKFKLAPIALRVPTHVTSKSIKSKVPMKFNGYKYRGLIANTYYKQYYILYEKEYENYSREDKLYAYILVKNKGKTFKIDYDIPPRSRVELGDTIYFSYGNFQLGPLKFV